MKKLLLFTTVAIMFFASSSVNAQIKVGAGVAFATDINGIGISVNAEYELDDVWEAAAGFTYFLEKNLVKWSALDLDAHYAFSEIDGFGKLYGIGGVNVLFASFDGIAGFGGGFSTSNVGFNVGVGTKIEMSDAITLSPEVKYALGNGFLQAGVKILFAL